MNLLFTRNELKMYLDNQCSAEERFLIDEALTFDISLQNELNKLKEEMGVVSEQNGPSAFTIHKILAYSKSLEVKKTQKLGAVTYQLN